MRLKTSQRHTPPVYRVPELEVDLRGVQVRVAQKQLHPPDVHAASDEVDGERVAERVRVYRFVDKRTVAVHDTAHMTGAERKDGTIRSGSGSALYMLRGGQLSHRHRAPGAVSRPLPRRC